MSIALTIGLGTAIWYKIGRLEGKVGQICERIGRLERWLNGKER